MDIKFDFSWYNKTMVKVQSFCCGNMDNLSYVITDLHSNHCIIIDPTWDINQLLSYVSVNQLNLTSVWLTHAHYDHIQGLETVIDQYPECPIMLHDSESSSISYLKNLTLIRDGDELVCGDSVWTVLHTPGHSPGGVCFYSAPHLITGDTLFIGKCGRADITGADVELLYHSLQRLKQFPSDTIIYPGHHYGDTITDIMGVQLAKNPYLLASDKASFIRLRMGR